MKVCFLFRGEILRPPENSVPQTIVVCYQEIGGKLVYEAMVLFLSKEYLDRNKTFFDAFHTVLWRMYVQRAPPSSGPL
jgi:hypothetical protein